MNHDFASRHSNQTADIYYSRIGAHQMRRRTRLLYIEVALLLGAEQQWRIGAVEQPCA